MARSSSGGHPARALISLALLTAALFGVIAGTVAWGEDGSWTPKLGLDLEGGTQIVLEPVIQGGAKVTAQTLQQSVDIIQARVDGSGVGEAEITTEGGRNVVVAVPGKLTKAQRDLIRQSSQLRFRPVLIAAPAVTAPAPTSTATSSPSGTATSSPSGTATQPGSSAGNPSGTPSATATSSSDQRALPQALVKGQTATTGTGGAIPPASLTATPPPATTPSATGGATPSASGGATPSAKPSNPSDLAQITPALEQQFTALDCSDTTALQGSGDDPNKPLVTCSEDKQEKYILGPVEVSGTDIKEAAAGLKQGNNGATTNEWEVRLDFKGPGADKFNAVLARLYALQDPQNRFGIVLDGLVVSAPSVREPIPGSSVSITGNFTQTSALELANKLKYGALPLSFTVQTEEQISPLLGAEQLQRGLLAGLIGLLLVVIYSLFQYRALGLVTVLSLVVAGVITYGLVVLLGNTQGLRLTLAGITGLIVSIGVTADSFIVYFERVRDEVRDGRSLRSAVQTGWKRAKRTILAADAINFLAAVVLYVLAAGGVRGFAFTLGLSTIVDIVVVFLFTHPVLTLLARTKFFGQGHKLSGLDPQRLGSGTAIGLKANLGTIASRRAAAGAGQASAQNHQEA